MSDDKKVKELPDEGLERIAGGQVLPCPAEDKWYVYNDRDVVGGGPIRDNQGHVIKFNSEKEARLYAISRGIKPYGSYRF